MFDLTLHPPTKPIRGAWLVCLTLLSGCAYHDQTELPKSQVPNQFEQIKSQIGFDWQQQPISQWWQRFDSVELNTLFAELKSQSLDLQNAQWVLKQTRALYKQQLSDSWPELNASISNRNTRDFDNGTDNRSDGLNFSAGYEVDLWGQRSAAQTSAAMNYLVQQQNYRSIALQLQSQLAQSYFTCLALRERLTIEQQNLTASTDLLQLIKFRFEAGSASRIELDQQRNVYLSSQAQLQALQRNLVSSERALAILLGRPSLSVDDLHGDFKKLTVPQINALQPAALLEFRPDVSLAEARLREQTANVFEERKKRWPRLTISADLSLSDLGEISQGWSGSLVEGLTMPLFNAGRIQQQIEYAESGLQAEQIQYQQTVLLAFNDALETLSEWQYQNRLWDIRQQELVNNERLYKLARLRYEAGDTDFLNLLSAQRSWFDARNTYIQAQNNRLITAVNVFRAMGVAPDTDKEKLKSLPSDAINSP